jgi:hypothetical protein
MFVFVPKEERWANRALPEGVNGDLVVSVLRQSLDKMEQQNLNFFIMRAHQFHGSAFQGKFFVRRMIRRGCLCRKPFDFLFLHGGFYQWMSCMYLPEATDEHVCYIVTRYSH